MNRSDKWLYLCRSRLAALFRTEQNSRADGKRHRSSNFLTGAAFVVLSSLTSVQASAVLVASILPGGRTVEVGAPATAFATVINASAETAIDCSVAPSTQIAASFSYRITDPLTNVPIGTADEPFDIAPGAAQSLAFVFEPTEVIPSTTVTLSFDCQNTEPAASSGLNSFQLNATAQPVADVVALAATLNADGITNLDRTSRVGAFAVASVNVGSDEELTVQGTPSRIDLPVSISVCQTDPQTGLCLGNSGPAPSVTAQFDANATPTFAFFVAASDQVAFDALNNRVRVSFSDASGAERGSTSVALRNRPYNKDGLIIEDDSDPETAFIYLDRSLASAHFRVNPDSGALRGLSVLTPDGTAVLLNVNEDTGLPEEMIIGDAVVVFGNFRLDLGLADVAIISPAGDITHINDIDYETLLASQTGLSSASLAKSLGTPSQTNTWRLSNSHPLATTSDINRRRQVAEAANAGWNFAACTMGAIVAAAVNEGSLPAEMFNVSAQDALVACGLFVNKINNEINKGQTAVVTSIDVAIDAVTDVNGLVGDFTGAVGSCGVALAATSVTPAVVAALAVCIKQIFNVAEIAGSKSVERLLGAYLRARRGIAKVQSFEGFCCTGPRTLEVGETARWRAAVIYGASPNGRFNYDVDFGDGTSYTLNNLGFGHTTDSHSYAQTGTYRLQVRVSDNTGSFAPAIQPFEIQVVPPASEIEVQCCLDGATELETFEYASWTPQITGGTPPYRVEVNWGDGLANTYYTTLSNPSLNIGHAYRTAGTRSFSLTVIDSRQQTVTAPGLSVSVTDPLRLDCCNGPGHVAVGATANWRATVSGGTPPYSLAIDWGDSSDPSAPVSAGTVSLSHSYAEVATHTVRLTLEDGRGKSVQGNFVLRATASLIGFRGKFNTQYGVMEFTGTQSGRLAVYSQDSGRILGTITNDTTLSGFWVEGSSNEQCTTSKDGSRYWGKILFQMEPDQQSWTGLWEYCEKEPTRSWWGTRID